MTYKDLPSEEFIWCNSWGQLVKELNHPNLLYCQNEQIGPFLNSPTASLLNRYRDDNNQLHSLPEKYVLLSGYSDYGICEQVIDHPNKDLVKLANSINYDDIGKHNNQYMTINLQTVDKGCYSTDKYSVKIDRYTKDTFNGLPDSLFKLFTSNLNCQNGRFAWLPFGLGVADFKDKVGPSRDLILKYRNKYEKNNLLYVNFSNHTYLRSKLNEYYYSCYYDKNSFNQDWITWETHLNQGEFFEQLCSHKFCLCPFGNGLDSYRIWECLYCGVVPVIQDSVFSRNLAEAGLPVHIVPNLFELTENSLLKVYSNMMTQTYNYDALRLSWWQEKIKDDLARLENPDGGCLSR